MKYLLSSLKWCVFHVEGLLFFKTILSNCPCWQLSELELVQIFCTVGSCWKCYQSWSLLKSSSSSGVFIPLGPFFKRKTVMVSSIVASCVPLPKCIQNIWISLLLYKGLTTSTKRSKFSEHILEVGQEMQLIEETMTILNFENDPKRIDALEEIENEINQFWSLAQHDTKQQQKLALQNTAISSSTDGYQHKVILKIIKGFQHELHIVLTRTALITIRKVLFISLNQRKNVPLGRLWILNIRENISIRGFLSPWHGASPGLRMGE